MFKHTFLFVVAMSGMLAFAPLPVTAQDNADTPTAKPAKNKKKKRRPAQW